MAIIKAKLSGYIPVCLVLNGGHIREFDRATEMVKLQLQTRGFLHVQEVVEGKVIPRLFKAFIIQKEKTKTKTHDFVNKYLK